MPQLRYWLLASTCLFVSGCQFPLFSDGSIDRRPENRKPVQDGSIQQVSAEVDATSSRQQRVFQLLTRGNQELTAGRLPDARLYFEQVLDVEPTNFHAHHMLARIGDQTQNFEDAEGHYLAALSASPGDPNLLSDMGYSYLLQGEYSYANTYLRRAIIAKPDHVMARRNMAALAAYQGDHNTALAWLRQVGSEQQAQTTLQELIANRPPRFIAKRDARDDLAPDATPAARELAEQLRIAKQQSSRDQWKREMAEWAQRSQNGRRDVTGTSFQNFQDSDPRRTNYRDSDWEMQSAMRALEEEYSQRLAELQKRSSIPPREQNQYRPNQDSRHSQYLRDQTMREQMRREAEAQLRAHDGGQPGLVIPPQFQPQHYQGQPTQQYQGQPNQPQQYQDPRTVSSGRGNPGQRELTPVPNVEFVPPPADYGSPGQRTSNPPMQMPPQYNDRQNAQGLWSPQGGPGVRNPQGRIVNENAATSSSPIVNDAQAARHAMALGMSAGPGSLVPFEATSQNPTSGAPNEQSFRGAVPIQTDPRQGNPQPGQQPIAQPGFVQPPTGQPGWTPGQVYTPPNGGNASLNSDWRNQQAISPTFNYATSQPITQQQHVSHPSPVDPAWRNQGVMTSPTTRTEFGPAQYVSREQQQLRNTTPANQTGAPASNMPRGAAGDMRTSRSGF